MHSELSECLAAMRLNPKNATEVQDQKDKIGEELADYFIRLADYCGKKEIDLEKELCGFNDIPINITFLMDNSDNLRRLFHYKPDDEKDLLAFAHMQLSMFYSCNVVYMHKQYDGLALSLFAVILLAERFEIDLEKAIAEKMKRNQSRPRLHNKKF